MECILFICFLVCMAKAAVLHVDIDSSLHSVHSLFKSIKKNDTVIFSDAELKKQAFRVFSTTGTEQVSLSYSGIEPCRDGGECFSGAWLGRSDHLVLSSDLDVFFSNNKKRVAHLLRVSYCEDSSNWFMHKMFRRMGTNYLWGDMPGQTIDALDFSGMFS